MFVRWENADGRSGYMPKADRDWKAYLRAKDEDRKKELQIAQSLGKRLWYEEVSLNLRDFLLKSLNRYRKCSLRTCGMCLGAGPAEDDGSSVL